MKIDLNIFLEELSAFISKAVAEGVRQGTHENAGVYTADQVCAMLGVTRPTLLAWTRQGKLKGLKPTPRGRWVYPADTVAEFIAARKADTEADQAAKRARRREQRKSLRDREIAMAQSGRYIPVEEWHKVEDLAVDALENTQQTD